MDVIGKIKDFEETSSQCVGARQNRYRISTGTKKVRFRCGSIQAIFRNIKGGKCDGR